MNESPRRPVVALVVSGAGGAESVREAFVEPLVGRGWTVSVTATPTACRWLDSSDELVHLERLTGLPVRTEPRLPSETSPHPPADCVVVAPASANTVAKLALGVSDNQALTVANEAIGDLQLPVVVFPRINAAHARHPAWHGHMSALESAGVHLVRGEDVWPLHEPRSAPPGRPLPWRQILDLVGQLVTPDRT
jgi:3-polyprenyl-4-hydroxybenzoate decarboxylase